MEDLQKLEILKAQAYDLIARKEGAERELREVNQEIGRLAQMLQETKANAVNIKDALAKPTEKLPKEETETPEK